LVLKFTWDLGISMSILFLIMFFYKFHLLNRRLTLGEKVNNLNEIFFITNGKATKKLNGYLISSKIKDIHIFIVFILIDIFLVFLTM
jgi:hypothetical protein